MQVPWYPLVLQADVASTRLATALLEEAVTFPPGWCLVHV